MTGFTSWLRGLLHLAPHRSHWSPRGEAGAEGDSASPGDVRIRQDNDRQIGKAPFGESHAGLCFVKVSTIALCLRPLAWCQPCRCSYFPRLTGIAYAEIKVVYNIALGLKRQAFRVELFVFYPLELGSVDSGFYHNLFQVVRLHTPQVGLLPVVGLHIQPGPGLNYHLTGEQATGGCLQSTICLLQASLASLAYQEDAPGSLLAAIARSLQVRARTA